MCLNLVIIDFSSSFIYLRFGYQCPVSYNPADFFLKTLSQTDFQNKIHAANDTVENTTANMTVNNTVNTNSNDDNATQVGELAIGLNKCQKYVSFEEIFFYRKLLTIENVQILFF